MIKKEVRIERERLRRESFKLRNIFIMNDFDKGIVVRNKQNEIYKKWLFYDKLIKVLSNENSIL